MYPDHFHLHSSCILLFHMNPVSRFPHGLNCFGEARFRRHYGMLLLKQDELIFVPEGDQPMLHLNRNQILKYSVYKRGKDLKISILYHMLLLSDSVSEAVRHYYFLVKNGKKEDWQF